MPPCKELSAVLLPAEVLNQSPDSRGHRARYPLGKGPRSLIADFPGRHGEPAFPQTPNQVPFYSLLPHLTRREPVKSLSGKERGAALAFGETEIEKQVGQEGVAELPGQPEVGHWARRKHRRLVLLSGRLP